MQNLALITVLFNSNEVLPDFFKSIGEQSYKNITLFLIDNSPSLKTRKIIESLSEQCNVKNIRHIENDENLGVAAANNIGIKLAIKNRCTDFIILNNDILFNDNNLFEKLLKLSDQKKLDMIAPKIYYHNSNRLWFAGGKYNKWKGGVKHFGDKQEDEGQYDKEGYISYAPTCFVYVKKEVFEKVGLMDEDYFVYSDDLDFMYRALRAGYNLYYLPNTNIYHKISVSTGGAYSSFSIYYMIRNRVFFIRKHFKFPVKQIAIFYTWLSLFILLLKSPQRHLWRKLNKGFFDGLKMPVK